MPAPSTIALFALASVVLVVVPGPSVLYIVTRSVRAGRGAGLRCAAGVQAGALVHVVAAAAGVSALVASSATAFTVVKYAGAAYLVVLGLRTLRTRPVTAAGAAAHDDAPDTRRSARRLFWEGALVNALNPKTALFFLALLPQFVDPARGPAATQALLLGAVFVLIAWASDSAYAVLAGSAGRRLWRTARARVRVDRASGAALVGLGAVAAATGERPRG